MTDDYNTIPEGMAAVLLTQIKRIDMPLSAMISLMCLESNPPQIREKGKALATAWVEALKEIDEAIE